MAAPLLAEGPIFKHQDKYDDQEFKNVYNDIRSVGNSATTSIPSGTLFSFAGSTVPTGYLACDGSAVSRATYATLFLAIGIAWGSGDGSTTFNIPNLNRRTLVGSGGSGTATLANSVGSTGGEETHTQTTAEMPVHNHTITDPGHTHSLNYGGGAGTPYVAGVNVFGSAASGGVVSNTTGITINNSGSGTAFNVIQPSAVVKFIIKT